MNETEVLRLDDEVQKTKDDEVSIIKMYGEDLTAKTYVTNPAIARESEIKKMMIVLLTPEKSALLVGHAGIGKTAIVEGLAYLIQRNEVPNALKGYRIIKINSTSLLGKLTVNGKEEMVVQLLVAELKKMEKTILFIDEVHTLIGGSEDGPMDLANILKPALDRGDVKAIGATTTQEYNIYIIRDRAFLRRFDRIEVVEPDIETTTKILMGSLPKIEKQTGVKFKYNDYVTGRLVRAIVDATSEYKRVYGLAAMYPDVSLSILTQAFSNALYKNKNTVDILDVYNAIKNSKRIYPDSIVKELNEFRVKYADIANADRIILPQVTLEEVQNAYDSF
ncbi:MAG: ATP-dependent Clp protease ATP-binding subunit [Bacilli bacterium]|jgi:ATP-dependent Clp protease ATP-binding subunit ClpA|nr:ATP-dependent Clp protease ATP-binding subunit [Bacilli bacterium]